MTFVFTFGANSPHRGRYVRIEADNYWRAQEAMIAACGTAWCGQYTEAEFAARASGGSTADRGFLREIAIDALQPGPGHHRASYRVLKVNAECVWILDEDGAMSVTNAAEEVVAQLVPFYSERRIIYRDTQGEWGELKHCGPTFIGFAEAKDLAL